MTPLRPAPHHTPAQTPEAAYARQLALARSSDVLDGAALLRLYEGMLRVEAFERTLDNRYRKGLCPGGVHLYLGEEAVATGVCSALYPSPHPPLLRPRAEPDRCTAVTPALTCSYNRV